MMKTFLFRLLALALVLAVPSLATLRWRMLILVRRHLSLRKVYHFSRVVDEIEAGRRWIRVREFER